MTGCHHGAQASSTKLIHLCHGAANCHNVQHDSVAPPVVRAVLFVTANIFLPVPSRALSLNYSALAFSIFSPAPFEPPRA
jgi:hypothetical protein